MYNEETTADINSNWRDRSATAVARWSAQIMFNG